MSDSEIVLSPAPDLRRSLIRRSSSLGRCHGFALWLRVSDRRACQRVHGVAAAKLTFAFPALGLDLARCPRSPSRTVFRPTSRIAIARLINIPRTYTVLSG